MSRAIVTYAAGAHEELLDVALPSFREFAARHGYDLLATRGDIGEARRFLQDDQELPPAWCKVPLLLDALQRYDQVVWFDCDLVVVDPSEDFPVMRHDATHALVRHFEDCSEVPNSGVWRLTRACGSLLYDMLRLEVFENHGWWEQAALMTLMGYCVPPEGSKFSATKCRCVRRTRWYDECDFMRLAWNSHPNYRAERPKIVHCSYPDMERRLEVMRALARDPHYPFPVYNREEECEAVSEEGER